MAQRKRSTRVEMAPVLMEHVICDGGVVLCVSGGYSHGAA